MITENTDIYLRAVEEQDVDLLYKWENNDEIWEVSETHTPLSKKVLKDYIETTKYDIYTTKQLRLLICKKEDNQPIGSVEFFDFDPFHQRAGVGIMVYNKEERKKGFAKQALQSFIDYCFNYLNMHQLYCDIATKNEASIKLFESTGFKLSGVKKQWKKQTSGYEDVHFFQLLNE